MGILNIRPAIRAGSKVVIGIAGTSGSGKTYTAIKLAHGMTSSPEKIGLLDAENGRGSLNADILPSPFLIGDLHAPFSPNRYVQSIKEFQAAGVEVLIIDSVSHEWEAEGGCESIAENVTGKMKNWKLAKAEHKKFMTALLQCDMHIICCFRAREKMDFTTPAKPKSLGIQPICEKNMVYEMTVSMMMFNEGINQQFIKMPEALRPIFGNGDQHIGENQGKSLIDWVNSGVKINKEIKSWENKLQLSANDGVKSLVDCWGKVPKKLQKDLVGHKERCKSIASDFDMIAAETITTEESSVFDQGSFNPAKEGRITISTDPAKGSDKSVTAKYEDGKITRISEQQNSDQKF